jgi:hypothetical protein
MLSIKSHISDVTFETVFEASGGFTSFSIPDINRLFSCDVEFESNVREKGAKDGIVIGSVLIEWFLVLEDFENSGSNHESSVFLNDFHGSYLIKVSDMESLHATVILYVPHIDHP